jgi:hypothetical protein
MSRESLLHDEARFQGQRLQTDKQLASYSMFIDVPGISEAPH